MADDSYIPPAQPETKYLVQDARFKIQGPRSRDSRQRQWSATGSSSVNRGMGQRSASVRPSWSPGRSIQEVAGGQPMSMASRSGRYVATLTSAAPPLVASRLCGGNASVLDKLLWRDRTSIEDRISRITNLASCISHLVSRIQHRASSIEDRGSSNSHLQFCSIVCSTRHDSAIMSRKPKLLCDCWYFRAGSRRIPCSTMSVGVSSLRPGATSKSCTSVTSWEGFRPLKRSRPTMR